MAELSRDEFMQLAALELAALIFTYPQSANPPAFWRSAIFVFHTGAVVVLSVRLLFRAKKVRILDVLEGPRQ